MKLVADLHTHTIISGHAYSTLEEMVEGANKKGLNILGITDHGPNLPGGPHPYYFSNLRSLPKKIKGIRVLKGVEANITDIYGSLDLPPKILSRLDIVGVGFHCGSGYDPGSIKDNTDAMISAILNPFSDIVVHPGNPEFIIDIDRVIMAAKKGDVLLEINSNSYRSRPGSKERCIEIVKKAKVEGVKVVIGSDAHYWDDIGKFDKGLEVVEEAGLAERDIINTSVERIKEFVARKKKVKEKVIKELRVEN
ncbi:phosphatase [Halonatronum saccharophilum]|uniref:phosphatase n=1 Tax=Halonatronum saccharophilum TaxID=150060 RepID=UPI000483F9D2|nr:phosphatase [Halonatronum saccharophilum]